ncbi:RidA family protein [Niallia oryzisoli]|uniref:RidA family protein n=1 Tax=Niallia oryzisoli TaxID=1737571 RepID=UPI003736C214
MEVKVITTDNAAKPGFSQGVKSPLSQAVQYGGLLYLSGQGPLDPQTNEFPTDVEAQTHAVMKNIINVLEAAGSSLDHVIKMNCYLRRIEDFPKFNAIYNSYFPNQKPARTTVEASPPRAGVDVEIEAVAYVPDNQ